MEVTGKIIIKLDPQSGTSRAGNAWRKQEYVLETQETYPKKVYFNFFGDRCDQYPLEVGQLVTVSFDINSREFNGRWYTDISAWKAVPAEQAAAAAPGAAMPGAAMPGGYGNAPVPPAPPAPGMDTPAPSSSDDILPF